MALEPSMVVELHHKLNKLKKEDSHLSEEIKQLSHDQTNEVQIHRLKKRKILVKDQIQKIDALLVPDIIA